MEEKEAEKESYRICISDEGWKHTDEQTVREILEKYVELINDERNMEFRQRKQRSG